jgi:hypothetical protein
LDHNVEQFTIGIHGAPQAAVDLIDFVEMPVGVGLRPAFT